MPRNTAGLNRGRYAMQAPDVIEHLPPAPRAAVVWGYDTTTGRGTGMEATVTRCERCSDAHDAQIPSGGREVIHAPITMGGGRSAECTDCGRYLREGVAYEACASCRGSGSADRPGRPFYPCAICRGAGGLETDRLDVAHYVQTPRA